MAGAGGCRTVAVADFVVAGFEAVLMPDELIGELHVPGLSPGARWGYYKVCRKASAAVLIGAWLGVNSWVAGPTSGWPIVLDRPHPLPGTTTDALVSNLLSGPALADDLFAIRTHAIALRPAIATAAA